MPSSEDIMLTQRLHTALQLLDIILLDHVLVTATGTASFVQKGWFDPLSSLK